MITANIQAILSHHMWHYGVVESDTLSYKEQKACELASNVLKPLVTVYIKVEDLEQLAITIGNPYSTVQIITFGLQITRNTCDFEEELTL